MDITNLVVYVFAVLWHLHFTKGHEWSSGLTFDLPNKEMYCFYENYTDVSEMIFQYQVVRGGRRDVDVTIMGPNKASLFQTTRQERGGYQFTTSTAMFNFCFSNKFSPVTHKVVYFEVRPVDAPPLAVEAGVKKPYANTLMEESMEKIHKTTTTVLQFQRAFRLREAKGRYAAEQLNRRVQWWSILQASLLVILGVGQVLVLRLFFTEKRKSTRPDAPGVVPVYPNNSLDRPGSILLEQSA